MSGEIRIGGRTDQFEREVDGNISRTCVQYASKERLLPEIARGVSTSQEIEEKERTLTR